MYFMLVRHKYLLAINNNSSILAPLTMIWHAILWFIKIERFGIVALCGRGRSIYGLNVEANLCVKHRSTRILYLTSLY